MARLLTPAEFGVMAAAVVVVTLATAIFDSSYGLNLIRRNTTRPEDVRTTLSIGFLLSGSVCILVILMSSHMERFFGFPETAAILSLLALTIPIRCVFSVAASQLQITGKFQLMARSTLLAAPVGSLLVGVPLALAGFGTWALAYATLVTSTLETAALAWFARLSFRPMIERHAAKEILSASIFNLATLLNACANSAFTAIIGRTLGEASLGIYSRGTKLLEMFVSATATQMASVFIPLYSQSRTDQGGSRATLLSVLEILYPIYAIATLLTVLHAPLIVAVLLGGQWESAVPVVGVLFTTIFPRCIAKAYENFSVANGVLRISVIQQAIYAGAVIAGALFAVQYGIVAVAISAAAAVWLLYALSMSYAVRISGLPWTTVAILHIRLPLIAVPVACVDYGILHVLDEFPVIIAHGAASMAGSLVFLGLGAGFPEAIFGTAWGARLQLMRSRLLGRLMTLFRPAERGIR